MKLLFLGDSITDADRDRNDCHNMGNGYPKYAQKYLKGYFPNSDIEFINDSYSGDKIADTLEIVHEEIEGIQPDIVSILIGVNDTWHRADERNWLDNDEFERRYRAALEEIKEKTHAKIVLMEQFLLPAEDKLYFREDLDPKIQITRKLAREYADLFIPLDGLLASEAVNRDWHKLTADGVHPTPDDGSDFIGRVYADWIAEIVEQVLSD